MAADVANLVSPVSKGEVTPEASAEVVSVKTSKKSEKSELEAAELELKQLEILERRANIEDLNERLDERKNRRMAVRMTSVTNGQTLNAIAKEQEQSQRRCNHRKGGNGAAGVMSGQGDSLWLALMKHRMLNGDVWIRCMRCGKTWKPPVKSVFVNDKGVFEEAKYQAAVVEYEAAKLMPTNNSPSSSYAFSFSDGGNYFREVTASTNLR
jgi:hypothetical protein